jgi:hypothetical protein
MKEGGFNEVESQYIKLIEQQKRTYQNGYKNLYYFKEFLSMKISLFSMPSSRDRNVIFIVLKIPLQLFLMFHILLTITFQLDKGLELPFRDREAVHSEQRCQSKRL